MATLDKGWIEDNNLKVLFYEAVRNIGDDVPSKAELLFYEGIHHVKKTNPALAERWLKQYNTIRNLLDQEDKFSIYLKSLNDEQFRRTLGVLI